MATVPIELPPPRGNLPVPFGVAHTGIPRAGLAGVGWDVPIAYVAWQRPERTKPASGAVGAERPERLMLSLGGPPQLMVPTDATLLAYVPSRGDTYMKLTREGTNWRLRTHANHEYLFTPLSESGFTKTWLLREVRDPIGTDRVTIEYDTEKIGSCDPDLRPKRYSYGFSAAGVPLHQVELQYQPWWVPVSFGLGHTCATRNGEAEAASVFDRSTDDMLPSGRSGVLTRVDIRSRNNLDPDAPARVVRAYELGYAPDADTGKPRLATVNLRGENLQGSLPLAEYRYGALRSEGDPGAAVFAFGSPRGVPRSSTLPLVFWDDLTESSESSEPLAYVATPASPPTIPPSAPGADPSRVGRRESTRLRHLIRDLTGDGVPDELWRSGSTWHLARGVVDANGARLDGPVTTWTAPSELSERTTVRFLEPTNLAGAPHDVGIVTDTWAELVDWNGDGRLDVIDAKGGGSVSTWKIWLNLPDGSGGLRWHPVTVRIDPIRDLLVDRDFDLTDTIFSSHFPSYDWPNATPLVRTKTWPRVEATTCRDHRCLVGQDAGIPGACTGAPVECTAWQDHVHNVGSDTRTEWQLVDSNQDGYPDVHVNATPITVCDGGYVAPWPRDPNQPWTDPHDPTASYQQHFTHVRERLDLTPCAAEGGAGPSTESVAFLNKFGAINSTPAHVPWTTAVAGATLERWVGGINRDDAPDLSSLATWRDRSWQVVRLHDDQGSGHLDPMVSMTSNGMPMFVSDRQRSCMNDGTVFTDRQFSGHLDLNGDGLLDFIDGATVRLNSGTGFGAAHQLQSPSPFALSEAQGRCRESADSVAVALDLDADGLADLLRLDGSGLLTYTSLVPAGGLRPFEGGRLIAAGNGNGAWVRFRYANAKIDSVTRHDYPGPEIVVAATEVTTDGGDTPGLVPTYYAYGEPEFVYDARTSRRGLAGYRRHVALSGLPGLKGGAPVVAGVLVKTRMRAAWVPGAPFAVDAIAATPEQVEEYVGEFPPGALHDYLPDSVPAQPFARLQRSYSAVARPPAYFHPNALLDCVDPDPDGNAILDFEQCHANGLTYLASASHTTGESLALGGATTETAVVAVDAFARPLTVRHHGDLARPDDDTCSHFTYAKVEFPSLVTAISTTDCAGTKLGEAQLFYDDLPFDEVARGRLTSRIVTRLAPDGSVLGQVKVASYAYDDLGQVASIVSERSVGGYVRREAEVERDAFGATVTRVTESASDVPHLMSESMEDSTWPSIGARRLDSTGVVAIERFDVFGRPTSTSVIDGSSEYILSSIAHDDTPGALAVTVTTFPGSTKLGFEAGASDAITETTVLDRLGRVRFRQRSLGASYGGASLVGDLTSYDALGRTVFVATPFEAGAARFVVDGAQRHGQTLVYDLRGRVVRTVEAIGYRPELTTTSVGDRVYVARWAYRFDGGKFVTTYRGPDESDPTSARVDWIDEVVTDALGQELERTRADDGGQLVDRMTRTWDRLGRLTSTARFATPSAGSPSTIWTQEYDSFGRVVRAVEPDTVRLHTYDDVGNLIESTWQDGATVRRVQHGYDGFDRVVSRTLSSVTGGVVTIESTDRYFYDVHSGDPHQPAMPATRLRGRLSWSETEGLGRVFYGYDSLGRAVEEIYAYTAAPGAVRSRSVLSYGGRMDALRLETPSTTDDLTYEYDTSSRVRSIRNGGQPVWTATDISPLGQTGRVARGNGVLDVYTFAPTGRRELTSWAVQATGASYEFRTLARDGAGRTLSESHQGPAGTVNLSYTFDGNRRLLTRTRLEGSGSVVEGFAYDGLGNTALRAVTPGTGVQVHTVSSNDPDRVCRVGAPTSTGPCQFTYDGAGNLTLDERETQSREFTYDAAQRVTRMSGGSAEIDIEYGPAGRARMEVTGANARTVWQFGALVALRQRDGEKAVYHRDVPGPGGVVVSLRTSILGNGAPLEAEAVYPHGDATANRLFTDSTGAVIQSTEYTAYGAPTASAAPTELREVNALWNGGEWLPEMGVFLLGPRTYDPELGRFLQRDPIATLVSSSRANPYAFSWNDPSTYADPTGLTPEGRMWLENPLGATLAIGTVGFYFGFRATTSGGHRPDGVSYGANTQKALSSISAGTGCDGFVCNFLAFERDIREGGILGIKDFFVDLAQTPRALIQCSMAYGHNCPPMILLGELQQRAEWMRDPIGKLCEGGCARNVSRIAHREGTGFVFGMGLGRLVRLASVFSKAPKATGPCFVSGTLILTERGRVPIEDVKTGDYVWSRSERTGEESFRLVVRTFVTPDQATLALHFVDDVGRIESLEATEEHPFWVTNRGWVAARELEAGDEVYAANGGRVRFLGGTSAGESATVYNFEVEEFHTYFVGEADIWVHNSSVFRGSGSAGGGGALRAEAGLLGSKKHGVNWREGIARARATGNPQGQFGSQADVDFAVEKARTLAPGQHAIFELPDGHRSFVNLPDGTTVPATRVWVRHNATGGTVHAYPME